MITPTVTTCVIVGFLVFQVATTVIPVTMVALTHWSHWPTNRTYDLDKKLSARRYLFMNIYRYLSLAAAAILNMILYGIILIETTLLIIFYKLNVKTRTSLMGTKNARNSFKENRLVKSVIGVCVFFIVTLCPRNIDQLYGLWPDTTATHSLKLRGFLVILYGLYQLLDGINHSFNLFVYVAINSRFRSSLSRLFNSRSYKKSSSSK